MSIPLRLLLAEDDAMLSDALLTQLSQAGYGVEHAPNGAVAEYLLLRQDFDAAVLDIGLPMVDGLTVLRRVRAAKPALPVLVLTALDGLDDRVAGLNAGADDYLTKPFALEELFARVHALTRRQLGATTGILRYQDLEMDRLRRIVRSGGRAIDLAPREFRLLEYLLLNPERVVGRATLLEKVWDMSFDPGTNVIDAHISTLRRKLEATGHRRLIQTVRGAGYALRAEHLE